MSEVHLSHLIFKIMEHEKMAESTINPMLGCLGIPYGLTLATPIGLTISQYVEFSTHVLTNGAQTQTYIYI